MNIKLKALLLTIALLSGLFGFVWLMIFEPGILLFLFVAVTFYALYRLVLNMLEGKEIGNPPR